jgi:hypothetical protein
MVDAIIRRLRTPSFGAADLRRGIVLTGAAELMFFFDAPLAHVVDYEEWQREERLRQTYQRHARMARRAGLAPPPQPLGLRA